MKKDKWDEERVMELAKKFKGGLVIHKYKYKFDELRRVCRRLARMGKLKYTGQRFDYYHYEINKDFVIEDGVVKILKSGTYRISNERD